MAVSLPPKESNIISLQQYYSYYQQQQPGLWGTSQYQLSAPPMPSYAVQPSWGGQDMYAAHYGAPDNNLFDYVWHKVKSFVGGGGYGREEAKVWHRRVYNGTMDVVNLSPQHVGAAAGYEALRMWEYHKSVYQQPLSGDHEREREGLAGLAIGEASKLWQYTGRYTDKYGRREACETAALTAERVFNQKYSYDSYEAYGSDQYPSRGRRSSFIGSGYDDDRLSVRSHRSHRSRSRRRSMSTSSYGRPITPVITTVAPYTAGYATTYPQVSAAYPSAGYGTAYPQVGAAYPSVGYGTAYPQGGAAYPQGYSAAYPQVGAAYPQGYSAAYPGLSGAYGGGYGSEYGDAYEYDQYPGGQSRAYEQYPGQGAGLPYPAQASYGGSYRPRRYSSGSYGGY